MAEKKTEKKEKGSVMGNWIVRNLVWAFILVVALVIGAIVFLNVVTKHNQELSVPDFSNLTVAEAEAVISAAAGKLLRGIRLFDIYRGTGVPEGKKSMAFSLELRADDRTLTDADSEAVISKVLAALKDKLNAVLR